MSQWQGFAVDLGASNGRTVLGEYDGTKLALSEVSRFANVPVNLGGTLYWNFLGLYHEVLAGLAKTSSERGTPDTFGIDSWAVDFGLLNANGDLILNPRHYRDHHNDGMMDEVFKLIPPESVYGRTGIQLMQINSIYQLMYLRLHKAWVLEQARDFLLFPDLINYFLTGVKIAEFTNATTTQLFNPSLGTWDGELLGALDLPTEIFPPIVTPFHVIGTIRDEVFPGGDSTIKVVTVGEHDTASAVFAVPHLSQDYVYISSGTWSLVGIMSDKPLITETTRSYNFTNEGGVNGDYRVLKNVMGLWLLQEVKRMLDRTGHALGYSELTQLAAESKPFQGVLDPDAPDFLAPENMIEAIQNYCLKTGQPRPNAPGAISRTIFESLALKYRYVIEKLEQVSGCSLKAIHIVGGGVHNELLCQMTADATGKPVIAGPAEATVIGNLCAQLIATRELKVAEVPQLVRNSFSTKEYTPQKDRSQWDEGYRKLVELMA
ncbi:rhamnulokinase [Paradesulfitobacterium ferrireducens]|uniref:rhamnulokinase n=1 Tax=Paradesulfitobacterium ferrireducens TaxID=2816476 RepID=UPI001A90A082|nr:rhamnulokinase family protein [Paradesulfitobacterium ferrireducens]